MSMTNTSTGLSIGKKVALGIAVMIVVMLLSGFFLLTNVEKAAPDFIYKTIKPNDYLDIMYSTAAYNSTTRNLTLTFSHNLVNSYLEQMRLESVDALPSYVSIEGIWLNLYNSRIYLKVRVIGITTTLTIPIEIEEKGNSIKFTWDRIYLKRVGIAKFITDGLLGEFKSLAIPLYEMGMDRNISLKTVSLSPSGIRIETSLRSDVFIDVLDASQDYAIAWLSRYAIREPDKAYVYELAVEVFSANYIDRNKIYELSEEVFAIEQLGSDLMYGYLQYISNNNR